MLPLRTVTKKQKKQASKKRLGIILIFFGLVLVNIVLVYDAFLEKPDPILSPLSKNQVSSNEEVEKKLKEKNIAYTSISTQKNLKYLVVLENQAEVIIDPNKDIDQQLSSLQLILKQLKIEGKTLRRLDFSYQKPIITF